MRILLFVFDPILLSSRNSILHSSTLERIFPTSFVVSLPAEHRELLADHWWWGPQDRAVQIYDVQDHQREVEGHLECSVKGKIHHVTKKNVHKKSLPSSLSFHCLLILRLLLSLLQFIYILLSSSSCSPCNGMPHKDSLTAGEMTRIAFRKKTARLC